MTFRNLLFLALTVVVVFGIGFSVTSAQSMVSDFDDDDTDLSSDEDVAGHFPDPIDDESADERPSDGPHDPSSKLDPARAESL